jgi:hypothetical protein
MGVNTHVSRRAALALVCSAALACGDAPTAREHVEVPPIPQRVTALRAEVDADRGTLTFRSVPIGGSSIDAAIYGDQGVTAQIYNTPVVITQPSPTVRRFEAQVGVRNLLSHVVGDEQSGTPPDTIGIFVFFTSGPTVTAPSPCGSCTVTMVSHHGSQTFTAPSQKYFHWQERLAPAGSPGDTTMFRKLWRFDASAEVTGFRFDVLISAPWAAPNETRWRVEYPADSIPTSGSEPRWTLRQTHGSASAVAAGGVLVLDAPNPRDREISFYRRDSVPSSQSAYAEASMRYIGTNTAASGPWLVIDDATRFVALGMRSNAVGFINTSGAFIGTPFAMNTTATHNAYQLRKYGADSAVFYVNGTRRGQAAYTSFSATNYGPTAPLIQFGHVTPASNQGGSSSWDYLIYEIGVAQP